MYPGSAGVYITSLIRLYSHLVVNINERNSQKETYSYYSNCKYRATDIGMVAGILNLVKSFDTIHHKLLFGLLKKWNTYLSN